MKALVTVVISALVVIGCATMTRSLDQRIDLAAPGCPEPVACAFVNKKGAWASEAPGMVSVRRSDDPLRVSCEAGGRQWREEIAGQRVGWAWANAILGGAIGTMVDATTDAHWDYPKAITVPICTGE